MSVGAIQIQIIINGKSWTITKDHAVSLKVSRVIGDSANSFTLEVFDESAWQIENELIGKGMSAILVRYSMASDLNKSITFSGFCIDYQLSFVGKATMLSIQGILSATSSGVSSVQWYFSTANVEWVGDLEYIGPVNVEDEYKYRKDPQYYKVDGKSYDQFSDYQNNEDVCGFAALDSAGNVVAYYNPTRIFKRIIHTYDGDKLGSSGGNSNMSFAYNNLIVPEKLSGIVINGTSDVVWNFFRNNGFSEEATAGIMGNIMRESSMDYTCIQKDKYGKESGPAARTISMGKLV